MMYQTILIAVLFGAPPALPPDRSQGMAEEPASAAEALRKAPTVQRPAEVRPPQHHANVSSTSDPLPEPSEVAQAKALYEEGTILYEAADYEGALAKFTAALAVVRNLEENDRVRLTLLYNIASAHEKQHAIDRDATHLRQALSLYRQYRDFAEKKGEVSELLEVEQKILGLERKLKAYETIQEGRAAAARVTPPPPPADRTWKRPRNVGIALTATGGAAIVAGIAMAVSGSRFEANARNQVGQLAELGVPMDHPAWAQGDDFIAQERRKGTALMGVGGSLAAVGAVGVGVGAYYLVKAKRTRGTTRASLAPSFSPNFAGVKVTGRF